MKRSRLSRKSSKARKTRMSRDDKLLQHEERVTAFMVAGMRNPWISGRDMVEAGDPYGAVDYQLTKRSFKEVKSVEELQRFLKHGNWALNTAFIYHDLAFINQINGGDEWAVFKYDSNIGEAFQFESLTSASYIKEGKFKDWVHRVEVAPDEKLRKLDY